MALRRVLPSRATPDKAPEGAAAPDAAPGAAPSAPASRKAAPPESRPDAAAAPEKTSPEKQNAPAASLQAGAIAAAATSAFGTLPAPAAQPRVLEESFTKPAGNAPEPMAPAPQTPAKPAAARPEPAPRQPREAGTVPAAQPQPVPLAQPQPEAPAPQPARPAPETAPKAERKAEPAPRPEKPPEQEAAPALEPSRPDNSPHKRRIREKRPRDFTAMGAPEEKTPERPKPMTAFAANVPVDTRPLDKVDEDLIATGIIAPPPADSLTGNLPTGLAETAFTPPPAARPTPAAPAPRPVAPAPQPVKLATPAPAPQPVKAPEIPAALAVPEPAAVPTPLPVAQPAPRVVMDTTPAPSQLPPLGSAVEPPPAPAVAIPAPQPAPTPAPRPIAVPPAFSLSSGNSNNTPLPPPQSDLPWTQSSGAAEWEIETPGLPAWQAEPGQDTHAPTAHMPPPADLYKPMGATSAPHLPSSSLPPRTGNNFTPELPGQRRPQGGVPWGLIAVVVLVLAGGGFYLMNSGGGSRVQQQLATLTSATKEPDLLPPPSTESASFYTPPAGAAVQNSSSAIVNFADVPPGEAGQPIVATGTEEMPKDLNVFDRFKSEVERLKAEKEGKEGAVQLADASATIPQPAATATPGITPEKLQEELAAYRSALSQSANPAALTPSSFRRDPDGYMDGKPQQAQQGTPMGSGALLPPPATSAEVLPPPELYTNNPKNLPVVNEPVANAAPRVRTLADFPDIEPYMPEREKVEIPKNIKPKIAATDFPALEVLSFVPGKGIVAFADGREGVLLIGESINGWELVSVSPENAEFRTGKKSYQVTADN